MKEKPLYITTTLPYVNADPHMGHALELVQADSFARYNRLLGREVFFNFGVDEHGQKVWQKAEEEGKDIQEYVDHYASRFEELKKSLNLSYDNFIRTTDEHHKEAAQEMWRRAEEAGDIYKKTYKGLYCVGCERFVKETELVEGKCPDHPTQKPQLLEEENYFFKFSKYQENLLDYLEKDSVLPEWRREEAQKFVKEGLEDFSISRKKEAMPWGVPVPGDEEHVMYVWFDALTNYISTLGWPEDADGNFKKFWEEGEVLQFAGKDQVRFQSLIWQAMLFSADIKNTDKVIYHGFINSGGQKMSKSLGNVINPFEMVDKYGTDAVRYYLLRHIHPFEDSDMTEEKFIEAYNGSLANGLGNLVARIMKMAEDNLPEAPDNLPSEERIWSDDQITPKEFANDIKEFNFNKVIDDIWGGIQQMDEFIQIKEPFKLIRTDEEEAKGSISHLVGLLWNTANLLSPFMPDTSDRIKLAIKQNKKPETLFPRINS